MNALLRHLPQFSLYVLSGGTAAVVDFGSYAILLRLGVWYIVATVVGGVLGFATTFLMNKYVAFKKKNDFLRHLFRFFIVDMANILVGAIVLYGLVDGLGMEKQVAKILTMGMVVLWNYFIYKFFVYV
ncbi:MAG: GtrA family protein [Candidatus Peribacteraceae bacterium]|nr:GtrA family protein [Candidatus Peribacteraceae bacterium]MDD5739314.1 GtrA family protein [Candidatus Peribacteraceae bacterium]